MKPARLLGFVSGLVTILCMAFLYTQRSYLYFIFPQPVFATNATFTGLKYLDVANTQYYLDPSAATSLVVAGNVGIGTTTTPDQKLTIGSSAGGTSVYNVIHINNDGYADPSSANASSYGDKLVMWNDATGKSAIGSNSTYSLWLQTNGNAASAIKFYTSSGTTPAERVRIDSNGNVGIGTTNPVGTIHLSGSANSQVFFGATSGATDEKNWRLIAQSNGVFQGQTVNDVNNSAVTWLQVDRTGLALDSVALFGNVGIGTSSPTTRLQVNDSNSSTSPMTLASSGLLVLNTDATSGNHANIMFGRSSRAAGIEETMTDANNNYLTLYNLSGGSIDAGLTQSGTGWIGIGTTSPYYTLDVRGDIMVGSNNRVVFSNSSILNSNRSDIRNPDLTGSLAILSFEVGAGEAMRIDNTGQVGIGTTSPDELLDVHKTGGGGIKITTSSQDGIGFSAANGTNGYYIGRSYGSDNGNDFFIYDSATSKRIFGISATDNSYLDIGNVGIGITSPVYKLHVSQGSLLADAVKTDTVYSGAFTGQTGYNLIGSSGYWAMRTGTNNRLAFDVYNSGTPKEAVTLLNNGYVGIGTSAPGTPLAVVLSSNQAGYSVCVSATNNFYYYAGSCVPSSIKNKTNVADLPDQSDKIFQLRPVKFNYKDTGEADIGLIAEEVAPILPDLIYYNNGEISGVKYEKLPIYLLQMTKKQQAQITSQQQQIDELKKIVDEQGQTIRELQTEVDQIKATQ